MEPFKFIGRKVGEDRKPSISSPIKPKPMLPGPMSSSSKWIAGEYDVQTIDREPPILKRKGKVYSLFGVGQSIPRPGTELDPNDRYSLTHLPTGFRICSQKTEADCMKIGEYLLTNHKKSLYSSFVKEVRSLVPQSIQAWLKECAKNYEWVDPVAFIAELKNS